ncbi:probable receptor-like protein kinase At2g23200 [Punica granatum]|nr:probable receptor-like protein kinase At2g23200 [Punica granatum]PKI41261.1 hypothetical protein CRG98_038373 [Punica granatum]
MTRSMEDLYIRHHTTSTFLLSLSSSFFLLLLLLLPSLPSIYSETAYTLPTAYFINCGSTHSVNVSARLFVGDSEASPSSFMYQDSSHDASNSSSSVDLYRTARIFKAPSSSYRFKVNSPGSPHFLRLHFYSFVSAGGRLDLSGAIFNVSVQGLTLLPNFSNPAGSANSSTATATVREFLLTVNGDVFAVYFTPIGSSSFAFVNALEFFPVPEGLVPVSIPTSSVGSNGDFMEHRREVLATRYRLNVGGPAVEPGSDTLWRQWGNDSGFLQNPEASQTKTYPDDLDYQYDLTGVDIYTAPRIVYQTVRYLNATDGVYSNVTWRFRVSPNSSHVVRFHFCDILGIGDNTVWFKLSVNDNFTMGIQDKDDYVRLKVPFNQSSVVKSGVDGLIKVSIRNNSGSSQSSSLPLAYLNGLEMMEMIGYWDGKSTATMPKKSHTRLILGVAFGSFGLLLVLVLVGVLALKGRRQKPTDTVSVWSPLPAFAGFGSSHGNKSSDPSISSNSPVLNLHLGLKISLSEILFATNNFDSKLMIGRGGFGNVYRATLRNGTQVAVKRSEPGSSQGLMEFQREIIVLSKIRHRHLVSLIGYCAEKSEMILVYEFMEKGTLREHLYNTDLPVQKNKDLPVLPWKQRLEICIGAAQGLQYLHEGAANGIIHRDVKSTNILLDGNYVAKVADFGLSKLSSSLLDQSQMSTGLKGTFGYLDPEYLKTQQMTEKSDVYAFGVVLLEVLCARPPIDNMLPREQMNLAEWGTANFQKGTLEKIVDPLMSGQINPNSLRKFGETAEKCLKEDDQERPSMADVLWDLQYALQLQGSPVPRQLHEDSTTNGSSMLGFSEVQRLPSFSMSFTEDDSLIRKENEHESLNN